jgi:UDP-N-acetylglucosamine transferase subunit ALG13
MPFDELLMEVDRLASAGFFGESIICQGGQSAYRMTYCEQQFVGRPSIDDLISRSSMVISHGGSTVVQLLMVRKPFIAFPNPRGAGDHQSSFLQQVATVADISWSRDVRDLVRLFTERRRLGAASLHSDVPRASDVLRGLLLQQYSLPTESPSRIGSATTKPAHEQHDGSGVDEGGG